ncbi:MAG: DUF3558 domain-containing protein [Rhodococcus sp.]|nr:DUF3558 domain-containing protein [Rhodococcus sp. (in: high G+C Gram-positive bacteria)]
MTHGAGRKLCGTGRSNWTRRSLRASEGRVDCAAAAAVVGRVGAVRTKVETRVSFGVPIAAALAAAVLLTSCGSDDAGDDGSSPAPGSGSGAFEPTDPGPFLGECGSVTDAEVAEQFGMPIALITRNSVGCEWEVGGIGGPSVTFSWYRGSPIGRERAGSELIGRPAKDIAIDGNPGFVAAASGVLCELGVQFGGDFAHWSVMYGDAHPVNDPCAVAQSLAETSVSRMQK